MFIIFCSVVNTIVRTEYQYVGMFETLIPLVVKITINFQWYPLQLISSLGNAKMLFSIREMRR